jgi:hypothetical protein
LPTTDWKSPASAFEYDTSFIAHWADPANVKTDDSSAAVVTLPPPTPPVHSRGLLLKGGVEVGETLSYSAELSTTDQYVRWGGTTAQWDLPLTPEYVNAADFGACVDFRNMDEWSNYLAATGFGLGVPAGATVTGIDVEWSLKTVGSAVHARHVRMRAHYTV